MFPVTRAARRPRHSAVRYSASRSMCRPWCVSHAIGMDRDSEQAAPAPPAERGGEEPELGTSVRRTSSIIERLAAAATPADFEGRAEFVGTPSFARGLWRIAAADASSGNRIALLRNGPATFSAMLELIGTAEKTVSLEGYIFRDDEVGTQFAEALVAAAQRGVKVRLLVDWVGR